MYIENSSFIPEEKVNMRGGDGTIIINAIVKGDDIPPNSRLGAEIVINPGCSIGVHEHNNECEIFYVTEGEGILIDNDKEYPFRIGDAHICYSGSSHGVKNNTDKVMKMFAVIITE